MVVAEYLRKSRSDDPSASIEETLRRHEEMLAKFAVENGLTIKQQYKDLVSGDSLYTRPEMLRLLEDVENGLYEAVLCMDLDRLGRGGMSDQGTILETFKYTNTKIITPAKTYDLNDDLDEELTEFQTFMARRELKTIKRRLQRGLRKTIMDGGYVANAPYGYEKTTINKLPSLKIVESEAEYVRMIYDMYVNQGIGCHTIAATLNSMGVKPRRSDSFSRGSVMLIVKNPTYNGKIVWDQVSHVRKGTKDGIKHSRVYNPRENWTIVDGIHPPIIDTETWEKAQAIMKSRYHSPFFNGIIKNPLAGVVCCAKCGRLLQRRPAAWGRGPEQLLCETMHCCSSSYLSYVEEGVLEGIRVELLKLKDDREKRIARPSHDYTAAIKSTEKELSTLNVQKNKLHDLLEQGVYDTYTYMERMGVLNQKKADSEATLDSLKAKQSAVRVIDYDATIKKIEDALEAYESSDSSKRNKILRDILERVTYLKEKGWEPTKFVLTVSLKSLFV